MTKAPPVILVTLLLSSCAWVVSAQTRFERVGSIPGPADVVRAQGAYTYVAAGKTLTIVDVSNPASPKRVGSYTFPQEIWGFRLAGSRAYVGANFFGLGILDVSDPKAPTLVGIVHNPRSSQDRRCLRDQGRAHLPHGRPGHARRVERVRAGRRRVFLPRRLRSGRGGVGVDGLCRRLAIGSLCVRLGAAGRTGARGRAPYPARASLHRGFGQARVRDGRRGISRCTTCRIHGRRSKPPP